MKKIRLLFIITLTTITGISLTGFAQNKKDQQHHENKIYINKKGEIHDHRWNKLGFISKDDIVKNNQGKTIYFIDKNGNVIDADGKNLGKAQKNGNYYNLAGENVIRVGNTEAEKCEILDPKGHNMGTVHKNYKLHACAAHCLAIKEKTGKAKDQRRAGKLSYKNKMVKIGAEDGNKVQIRSGLQSGDIVVVKGAYLLNSEYIFKKGINPMEGMKM